MLGPCAHPTARRLDARLAALGTALALAAAPAQALYKVVGPDGRVTYTDRPPPGAQTVPVPTPRATPAASAAITAGSDTPAPLPADARTVASWPPALRQAVMAFPVTLYTAAGCPPCEEARRLLQRRGVPYSERLVRTEEDAKRLEQLTGARMVPAASVGRQALSGWQEQDWQGWLDTAGYPRNRVLPPTWQPAPATPLARPAATTTSGAASAPTPRPTSPLPPPDAGPGPAGIRF